MTVISYNQNKVNNQRERKYFNKNILKRRYFNSNKKFKKTIMIFNFVLFITCSLILISNCNFTAQSVSFRLDIQNLEKEILSFEEKNAQLKTEISEIQNSNQWKEIVENRFNKESQPKYFVFTDKEVENKVSALNYEY